MVGGEKHPLPNAIYNILSSGCDFQGRFGSVPPQEVITHSFLPLTSQGTALDIRSVRIQNSQLRQPPSPLKGDEDEEKAGFADINLLVKKVLLTSRSGSTKLDGRTGSPLSNSPRPSGRRGFSLCGEWARRSLNSVLATPGQAISQFSVTYVRSTDLPRICLALQGGAMVNVGGKDLHGKCQRNASFSPCQ